MYTPPPPVGVPNPALNLRSRLRPMGIGDILDETFRLYRANFALFMATVAIVEVPLQIINIILQLTIAGNAQSLTGLSRSAGQNGGLTHAQVNTIVNFFISVGVVTFITLVITLIALVVQSGALAVVISNRYLDRPITVGDAYRAAMNRFGTLLGAILWLILRLVLLFIACFVLIGIPFFIFFYVAWSLIAQVIMLENSGAIAASRRSRQLIQGYWWKTCGLLLVTFILVAIVTGIPAAVIGGIAGATGSVAIRTLVSGIVGLIVGVLVRPIQAAATTLLFYDLKIRKEAFDLEALAQQAGIAAPAPSTWQ